MSKYETIWKQIEETFAAEANDIFQREVGKYQTVIGKVLKSGKSVRQYFVDLYSKYEDHKDNWVNDEYYRDITGYDMLVYNSEGQLYKSAKADLIIEKKAQYYVDMLKWKLQKSVFKYVAGIDMVSVDLLFFKSQYPNGFAGEWSFVTSTGEKGIYETKTIVAEGDIVRAHYRYISHVKGKVNIDHTERAKALKRVEEMKPKVQFNSKEEKELDKKIKSGEANVKRAKWHVDHVQKCINDWTEKLANVDKQPERYKDPVEAKAALTKTLGEYKADLPAAEKGMAKAEKELEEVKSITLEQVKAELDLKADKKMIKELKDRLNSFSLKHLQTKDPIGYEVKKKNWEAQLNDLYAKHPAIKQKEDRLKYNHLIKEIKHIKQVLSRYDNAPVEEFNQNYVKNISADLLRYETELATLNSTVNA